MIFSQDSPWIWGSIHKLLTLRRWHWRSQAYHNWYYTGSMIVRSDRTDVKVWVGKSWTKLSQLGIIWYSNILDFWFMYVHVMSPYHSHWRQEVEPQLLNLAFKLLGKLAKSPDTTRWKKRNAHWCPVVLLGHRSLDWADLNLNNPTARESIFHACELCFSESCEDFC